MSSHGEDLSLAAFWDALPSADRRSREWLKGPMITTDDLLNGSTTIERMDAAAWWRAAGQAVSKGQIYASVNAARAATGGASSAAKPRPAICFLTKHRGKPWAIVQDEDPGYFRWAVANVSGVRAVCEKAGLLDDEDAA